MDEIGTGIVPRRADDVVLVRPTFFRSCRRKSRISIRLTVTPRSDLNRRRASDCTCRTGGMRRTVVTLMQIMAVSLGLTPASAAVAAAVRNSRDPGRFASIHLQVDVDNDGILDAVSDSTWLVDDYLGFYGWGVAVRRGLPGGSLGDAEVDTLGERDQEAPDGIASLSSMDYDRDNWPDFIVRWEGYRYTLGPVGGLIALHNRGDGTFLASRGPGVTGESHVVAVDLNMDNRLDFATYSNEPSGYAWEAAVAAALILPDGLFASQVHYYPIFTARAPIQVETADIDHDGRSDIVLRHPTEPVWYRSVGDGTLESPRPLPGPEAIDLEEWSITRTSSGVELTWRLSSASRRQFVSMHVETASLETGPYEKVRDASPIAPDAGGWIDSSPDALSDRWYRLVFVNAAGAAEPSRPLHAQRSKTESTTLTVTGTRVPILVRYTLPRRAYVTLSLFDARGKLRKTLVRATMQAGAYGVTWNGRDNDGISLARGGYFLRLATGGRSLTHKVILTQ